MKRNPAIFIFSLIVCLIVLATTFAPAGSASREKTNRRVLTPMTARRPVRHTRSQSSGREQQPESTSHGEMGELVELVLPVWDRNRNTSGRSDLTTGLTQAVQAPQQEREVATPEVIQMVGPVSQDKDLRVLARVRLNTQNQEQEEDERRLTRHPPPSPSKTLLPAQSDPIQPVRLPALAVAMPTPSLTFDGITSATSGCGCTPPDPIGDVGPNHYVQAVNSSFQVFNKSGGSLAGPTSFNSFFSAMGAGTPCGAGQNAGDPGVIYDHLADRWVISDIAFPSFPGTSFYQCLAVSKTADPVAGGWWLYALQVDPANPTFLGDYPKFGIWPDAYYFSVNLFSNNTTFNGVRVFALPRSAMINGTGAPNPGAIAFTVTPANLGDIYSLLPATFRSGSLPPAGAPEYFMAINSSATAGTLENQVFTWRFHTDFTTPANSTLGVGAGHTPDGAVTVNNFVDAFTATTFLIVPQTGTSSLLDSLGDKLMYPLVYQNLGGAESLYVSHTVNNNQGGTGPTAIRWYKFNVTGGTIPAAPAQQQTFNNGADGLWRFMPSLTVDAQGNLAIGYSQSSSTTEPAIAYAGRLAADPLNTLAQGEAILSAGGGHQTSLAGRWGDYTSTSIDPSNNCTIWHTSEYYSTSSTSSWKTRIGNFSLPGCSQPAIPTVPVSLPSVIATNGATVNIPVTVTDLTGLGVRAYDLQVTYNPAVLQPLATPYDTSGSLSSGMFITPNAANSGHLIISAFQTSDLSGSGTLLNLKFTVVGTAGQSTPLTFENYTDPNTLVHTGFRFNAGNPQASTTNGSLSVNTAPTINAAPVTRQAGSPNSNSTIATVNDNESGAGGVSVTVTSANPANGVTVSNIVNTNGTVTADVVAACGATSAGFTLTATDGNGTTATATLNVTVNANTAPAVSYSSPQSVIFGGSLNVSPASATDDGSITGYSVQSVVPALTTAPTVNASGVVSVTNAQPSGSHVITIRATDNCGLTNDAQFTLDVGAMPSFAVNDVTMSEGNSGTASFTFNVTKTGSTALNATVDYRTVDGTAVSPSDFSAITTTTLTFLPADTTKQVTVFVNGDTTFEPEEAFTVHLLNPGSATIGDADGTGTITNDDTQPTISINDVSVTEGNSGTITAGFTVSLSNASSQTITVNYATADNTATAGSDYVGTSGTLTFTAGQTSQPINVTVNGDTTFESTETFNVNLTLPTNATIADSQGVGTITNDDTPSISGHATYVDTVTPGKNVTMTLTATAFTTQTTTTDANGNYTFANVPLGNDYTVTPSKTGDVNGIESLDASDTARYVAGLTVPSTNQQIAADSDGDAILTSFDASLIARFVVGLPNAGNVGTWKFIPASRFYPALSSNQTNQNFSAILVGDTGGNWLPSLASGDWLSSSTNATTQLAATPGISPAVTVPVSLLNVAGAGSGSIVSIPVTVSDLSGLGVRAYDLHLSFDPAVLQPLATPYDTTATLSSGMFITPNATNSGHLIISAFQVTDLSGPGTLLNLKFTVVGTAGQSTLLTFEDYADPNNLNHAGFRFNAGNPRAITTNAWLQVDGVNATGGNISGTITDATGAPVSGTMIALSGAQSREAITDANGNYSFAGVDPNGFYTVTPARANYTFGPANRSFRMLGIHTEASFTGTANGSDLNPLDTTGFFLRQHYLDFLNREPDQNGFNFWLHEIDKCAPAFQCTESTRINVSAAFFLSIEFEGTGDLVERLYKAAYGDATGTSTLGGTHQLSVPVVRFNEFLRDTQAMGRGVIVNQAGWERALESNKETFTAEFVQRSRFAAAFPASMSATEFVDALNRNAGNPLSPAERDQLISDLLTNARTRAQVLRAVAEDPDLDNAEFNRTFVLMQYFGYLRRDPNDSPDTDYTGYDFWLAKLNRFNGSFVDAEMVKAFLLSSEFRRRFR